MTKKFNVENYTLKYQKKSLDECIQEIENIKNQLESTNLPLEEMIELYKKGKTLGEITNKKLEELRFEFDNEKN
jgi:exodeoxyribonuclease VII small subunit